MLALGMAMRADAATGRLIGGALSLGQSALVADQFNLDAGAVLIGNGEVRAPATLAGTVSPGDGAEDVGTLSFSDRVAFNSGVFVCHAATSTNLDRIRVTGDVTGVATVRMTRDASAVPFRQVIIEGGGGSDYTAFGMDPVSGWTLGETNALDLMVSLNGGLAIQVTPASGSWQLTAPVGYTGPTSGTGNLATVSVVAGQYAVSYGALSGYVAPSNQSQFVTGTSTTLFVGVYLLISTNIGTPQGVSATEGSYTNKIRITWQGVDGAIGYVIWRSQTNDPATAGRIADIPENGFVVAPHGVRLSDSAPHRGALYNAWKLGSTYIFDDYDVDQISSYYYWVRAKTATLISPMSYVVMGYAALSPEQTQGAADIAVSDLVFLPVNMTNLSHAGTVSCRLANNGPDTVNAAAIGFDFHMVANVAAPLRWGEDAATECRDYNDLTSTDVVWIGSDQGNYALAAGEETLVILTPTGKRNLTARADLSGIQQVKVTVRHLSALYDPNAANNTAAAPGTVRVKASGVNSPGRSPNDYDGDGKSDAALCRSDKGVWAALLSGVRGREWTGIEAATSGGRYWTWAAAGDYDGDGKLDYGLYEERSGVWWILKSSDGQVSSGVFGGTGFRPASGDYDGDSKSDPAVYGPAWGYWVVLMSGSGYAPREAWAGGPDYDEPVVADYDGDGLADLMAYHESDGHWAGLLSGQNYAPVEGWFGGPRWAAGAADFDGDGLADPVVYKEVDGVWWVLLSTEDYQAIGFVLGGPGYTAVAGDFDGDGRADPVVYNEQGGAWYGWLSGHDYEWSIARFGGPGYQPVSE